MEHTTNNPLMNAGQGGTRNRDGKPVGRIFLRELALDRGGYDREGQYWGLPSRSAGSIWVASCGPSFRRFTWGHHLEDAARNLEINPANLAAKSQRKIDTEVKKRLAI